MNEFERLCEIIEVAQCAMSPIEKAFSYGEMLSHLESMRDQLQEDNKHV